jgi:putative inorganic carbon (HCO3(-)) transporter
MAVLAWLGVVAACVAAAGSLVSADRRLRATAMLLALALAPVIVAGDLWDTERFRELRDSPAQLAAIGVVATIGIAGLAALFLRFGDAFAPLAIGVLAFRVPVDLGGETSNLLIPLYLVIAAGTLAYAINARRARGPDRGADRPPSSGEHGSRLGRAIELASRGLPWLLAGFLVLYGVQSAYSSDLSKATENVAFFFVPFAVLLALLLQVRWTPRVLAVLLVVIVAEGLVFSAVGLWQLAVRDLFWNPSVIAGNEVHTYFRVNSVFWDPNVFGRYLALSILVAAAYMVWTKRAGHAIAAAIACGALIVGLTLSYSQSSIVALLAGLIALVAPRWGVRWSVAAGVASVAVALVLTLLAGVEPTSERSLEVRSSGRVTLIRGGLEMAGDRPALGYGAGSFQEEFAQRHLDVDEPANEAISHSEPITVAAEQGAVGVLLYAGLVLVAFVVLLGTAPGIPIARTALVACFVAMVVHSLAYAGFLIDPVTWALLGVGLALGRAPMPAPVPEMTGRPAPEPAPSARPSLASPGASSSSAGS